MRVVLLILLSLALTTQAFNFLVVCPVFAYSHIKFMNKVADILADEGHNVTLLQTYMVDHWGREIRLAKNKNVKIIDYHIFNETSDDTKTESAQSFLWDFEMVNGILGAFAPRTVIFDQFQPMCEKIYQDRQLHQQILALKPDGYVAEAFDFCSLCFSALFDKQYGQACELLDGDVRNWEEIVQTATFFFYNNNPYVGFPMPILEKSVEIGGITVDMEKTEQVDEEYDNILNLRNSTVLMSFGTVVLSRDMPETFKQGIIATFSALPETTFIWKYEKVDEEEIKNLNLPPNVILKKWVPQPSFLPMND